MPPPSDARPTGGPDHLTDYERAVCYYTLPRVVHPISYGIVLAYGVCLLEAAGVLIYGIATQSPAFTRGGAIATVAVVLFGVIVFMIRALLNEVRGRRALLQARGVPDAGAAPADTPNPFAHHILLRRPVGGTGNIACAEIGGERTYEIQCDRSGWQVKEGSTGDTFEVRLLKGAGSFSFDRGTPRCVAVFRAGKETARVERRPGLPAARTEISRPAEARRLVVRSLGIYWRGHLVGRVYTLRGWHYLDLDANLFDEGALAYFLTVS